MAKGEETRERILQHALAIASEVGFEGLSIGELAKAADMSKSGLFAHFDSKEDLQLQALATARRSFLDNVITPAFREPRGEPRIRALFEKWLTWEEGRVTPGGCPFVVASYEYVALPLAIFWGWVVFGEVPDPVVWVGIALIAGAGLAVFARERALARPVASARPIRRG